MEQTIDIQKPTEKVYKDRAILIGTFLGGPLVAGYFIAENFKVFGEYGRVKKTWVYTIIATIIIFAGIVLIPDDSKIPNGIIPLIYTGIASYLLKHFQGQNIETHINSGGELFGTWRAIGIGLIGLVVITITILTIVLLTGKTLTNASIKTYGVKKHEIAFDKSNITEREVDILADNLFKTTFFDEAATKYIHAKKGNNTYELSLSVINGVGNNSRALQPFIALRANIQTFYPNDKIILNLVAGNLDNIVKKLE